MKANVYFVSCRGEVHAATTSPYVYNHLPSMVTIASRLSIDFPDDVIIRNNEITRNGKFMYLSISGKDDSLYLVDGAAYPCNVDQRPDADKVLLLAGVSAATNHPLNKDYLV